MPSARDLTSLQNDVLGHFCRHNCLFPSDVAPEYLSRTGTNKICLWSARACCSADECRI